MKIAVRNMVCRHCVAALARILESIDIEPLEVGLGYAIVADDAFTPGSLARFDSLLRREGFERIADGADAIVQKVKDAVMHYVRSQADCRLKLSAYIEEQVGMPYDTLTRIFSGRQGRTIEKFAIAMRVEWVKELLSYGNLTITEIAYRTGYSSAAHLSRQFKAVTGLTPTQFIEAGCPRLSLADV